MRPILDLCPEPQLWLSLSKGGIQPTFPMR
jgi:hypothetical protein